MKLRIKRFDTDLPLPQYKTKRAAALDLAARTTTTIAAHQVAYIPLNIAIELPADHWALMAARSSLHKKGLMLANGIGVGDEDFCGDDDEYQAILLNFTNEEVEVKRGERIAQLIVLPRSQMRLEEVTQLGNDNRGGMGSTGF